MEPALQLAALILEAPAHHVAPEVQEILKQGPQADPFRDPSLGAVETETRQVHGHRGLERGALVEEGEDLVLVDVLPHLQPDLNVVRREIAHVEQRRKRPVGHDLPETLDELRLVDSVGNRRDEERPHVAPSPPVLDPAPDPDRSLPLLVDLGEPLGRIEDLAAGREVRTLHRLRQLAGAERRTVQQPDERLHDLEKIVGRNVGGDTDRDPGGSVHEQQRQAGGQDDRFVPGPVVGRTMGDGVQPDLPEHVLRGLREPALGVPHRRRRIAVERTEVAGALDQRQTGRERLRHPHQRLVDGGVAVGVVAAHHVAHHLGALAEAAVGAESLAPHRGQDAPLYRFEAVPHVGQRPAADDRQRVGPVTVLDDLAERGRDAVRPVIRTERQWTLRGALC